MTTDRQREATAGQISNNLKRLPFSFATYTLVTGGSFVYGEFSQTPPITDIKYTIYADDGRPSHSAPGAILAQGNLVFAGKYSDELQLRRADASRV